MSRFLVMVMFAVGLALSGCAPPEETGGAAQDERGSEKAAKDERPGKEKPKQERPGPKPDEKEAKPENPAPQKANNEPAPKPKPPPPPPEPEPQPESPSASSSASASASASPAAGGNYDETVTVSRVVDGDTIEISPAINGVEDVRLIGMDTPETVDPGEEVEPLGPEASTFAAEELTGQSVGLEFGAERTDQYDRLLAYVYVGEEMFNEVLVEEGYAQAYPYDPNTRYEEGFAAAQEDARAAGLGIWGLSLDQQCLLADRGNGIGEGTPGCSGATASASSSASSSVSGSSSASAGSGGTAPAAPTSGGDIDCDQVNGPIPTPPGDPDGLDGDGDGLACE